MQKIRQWWNGLEKKTQTKIEIVGGVIVGWCLLLSAIFWAVMSPGNPQQQVPQKIVNVETSQQTVVTNIAATPTESSMTEHTVKAGEYIISIASQYNVPWESIVLANEETLKANTTKYCANRSDSYTHSRGRRGHFCNYRVFDEKGQPLVYANTLMPDDVLKIPSRTAPEQIQNAVSAVRGKRVVVVIDETGSMGGDDGVDDRARVSAWYLQAIKNADKEIVRVVMFAQGNLRELDASEMEFQTHGGFENTRHALEHAANKFHPDAIVLVTDEPGDDWADSKTLHLPPVIAHSLSKISDYQMQELANFTNGWFLSSHHGLLANNLP
jgi:LysM repeat protein